MKLTVLVDNQTLIDRYFRAEPGLSFWLEDGEKSILFDTGYSDLFLENGRKMGLEPTHADYVVLSHGHNDHTWGLEPLIRSMTERATELGERRRPTLVAHPDALLPKRYDGQDIGTLISEAPLSRSMDLRLGREPVALTDRLTWLGEIPRIHDFEPRRAIGELHRPTGWEPDYLADDSALVWRGDEGLVIITGCSHAGICNIITQAVAVAGDARVKTVVGGFHLLKAPRDRLHSVSDFFRAKGIQELHACHCTDFSARAAFLTGFCQQDLGVGATLIF